MKSKDKIKRALKFSLFGGALISFGLLLLYGVIILWFFMLSWFSIDFIIPLMKELGHTHLYIGGISVFLSIITIFFCSLIDESIIDYGEKTPDNKP